MRGTLAPGTLGGPASVVVKAGTGTRTRSGRIGRSGPRRDGPAPWLPWPSLSASRWALVARWLCVGGAGQVCVRGWGEAGSGTPRTSLEPPPVRCLRSSAAAAVTSLPGPPRSRASPQRALLHSQRAPASSRVCIARARPCLPSPRSRGGLGSWRRRPKPPPLAFSALSASAALPPSPTPGDPVWSSGSRSRR